MPAIWECKKQKGRQEVVEREAHTGEGKALSRVVRDQAGRAGRSAVARIKITER